MRFAETVRRAGAIMVLTAFGAGCASVGEPMKAVQEAVAPATSALAAAPAAALAAVQPEPVVSPAAQRAFDDAGRALKAGRTDEAERGYRALVQSAPDLGGPHANLGLIYRNAGKLKEAAAELETAVRLSDKQPVYLNQLGVTYRLQGRFEKAREAYDKAIALDANYGTAILNLGILHDLYLGDGKRALELYERYLALAPGGDAAVTKWVAELKNRKPAQSTPTRKEKA
jgi:tetratricopeptide (TPR) repeat protein